MAGSPKKRAKREAAALAAAEAAALAQGAVNGSEPALPSVIVPFAREAKVEEKNNGGRPPKLVADDHTLQLVEGFGKIQATNAEVATVLGTSRQVFEDFLSRNENAQEAFERGKGSGKMSLRRAQFKAAIEGNPAMLIWLGKQMLEQKDRHEHTGEGGGAIKMVLIPGDENA